MLSALLRFKAAAVALHCRCLLLSGAGFQTQPARCLQSARFHARFPRPGLVPGMTAYHIAVVLSATSSWQSLVVSHLGLSSTSRAPVKIQPSSSLSQQTYQDHASAAVQTLAHRPHLVHATSHASMCRQGWQYRAWNCWNPAWKAA